MDYYSKTITIGSATVIIRRPVLDKTECKQREKAVMHALEIYGRSLQSVSK